VTTAKRTIEVELEFLGHDRIIERPPGTFHGGVPDPRLSATAGFNVLREVPDEDGILNPLEGDAILDGALQINLWGDSASFRELGRYLLALAELDTTADPDFHQHHELTSADGRSRVHLIVRKTHT
jgi:hypothetical protein